MYDLGKILSLKDDLKALDELMKDFQATKITRQIWADILSLLDAKRRWFTLLLRAVRLSKKHPDLRAGLIRANIIDDETLTFFESPSNLGEWQTDFKKFAHEVKECKNLVKNWVGHEPGRRHDE